jgi:hypothetical protein
VVVPDALKEYPFGPADRLSDCFAGAECPGRYACNLIVAEVELVEATVGALAAVGKPDAFEGWDHGEIPACDEVARVETFART